MHRHRRTQAGRLRHARSLGQMASLARCRRHEGIVGNLIFTRIAPHDVMVDGVAMAVDACQAGLQMDVLLGRPLLGLLLTAEVDIRMAVVTPLVRRLADDVKKHLVVGVERAFVVHHMRLFFVALGHERVERLAHVGSGPFDRSELTGAGRRPAVILFDGDLNRPAVDASHVLAVVAAVAGQAVDRKLAGNVLSPDVLDIGRLDFARSAARHVPAEELREREFRQPKRTRLNRPGPWTVRKWNLDSQLAIHIDPGFARPAGWHIAVDRVEVPPVLDQVVTVAFATGELCRERQQRIRIGLDRIALLPVFILGYQRDQMDRMRPAPVALVAQQSFLCLRRFLRPNRRQRQQEQQDSG